jgi:hypothetical protein
MRAKEKAPGKESSPDWEWKAFHIYPMRNGVNPISPKPPETRGDMPFALPKTSLGGRRLMKVEMQPLHRNVSYSAFIRRRRVRKNAEPILSTELMTKMVTD